MTPHILPFRARNDPEDAGNAAARQIRDRQVYEPMLPDDISESMLEESRQRAREMVFSAVVFAFAIIGAAWSLGYLVGTVGAWWAA